MNKNDRLGSYTTFGRLQKIILGEHYRPDYFDQIKESAFRSRMQIIAQETQEDIQKLQQYLLNFNVELYQPKNYFDKPKSLTSANIVIPNPRPPITPGENCFFIDNKMFSFVHFDQPSRYYDEWSYHELFLEWHKQGAERYQMPKGPAQDLNKNLYSYDTVENDYPYLDASILTKFGDKIFYNGYTQSSKSLGRPSITIGRMFQSFNDKGIDWLQEKIKNNITLVNIADCNRFVNNIDFLMWVIKPGLVVSSYPKADLIKRLPQMSTWDVIQITCDKKSKPFYWQDVSAWSQQWLENKPINSLFDYISLDENNIVMSTPNSDLEKKLSEHGVQVDVINFRHMGFWGHGFREIVCDIARKDECIDYFK